MKNKRFLPDLSAFFFLLTLLLAFVSWGSSIYGAGEVQSLLSAEGIRWVLGHVVENYVQTPALGVVLVLLMGGGIVVESGLYDTFKRLCRKEKQLSRKERRALTLSSAVLLVYVALIAVCVGLPWNFLLGVTGSWLHSPFAKGFIYLFSLGIGLTGVVYGYVSDAFKSVSDVVNGMSGLISRRASYFVTLFFVAQFFSAFSYTRLSEWFDLSDGVVEVVYQLCCYLPLLL